jgi:hypothetical protein
VVRTIIALTLLALTAPLRAQPTEASLKTPPAALQLLQNDWVLMNWALKFFDANHDILIDPNEARAATDQFRSIADSDHDGRVTPEEYRAARKRILTAG